MVILFFYDYGGLCLTTPSTVIDSINSSTGLSENLDLEYTFSVEYHGIEFDCDFDCNI